MIKRQIIFFNVVNEVLVGGQWAEVVLEKSHRCCVLGPLCLFSYFIADSWKAQWPSMSFRWLSLTSLKKEMPCVILPLLSRMNLTQRVGTTSRLFQSRLVIYLLQRCYLQLFWELACLHQKQRILSLRRLSQDLGFGFSSRIILEPALNSPNCWSPRLAQGPLSEVWGSAFSHLVGALRSLLVSGGAEWPVGPPTHTPLAPLPSSRWWPLYFNVSAELE